MIKQTPAILNFDHQKFIETINSFEDIKTFGSEAKFKLSGITLRFITMRILEALYNNQSYFIYDPINKLLGGFPYEIDTKLDKGVIIFEEEIK